MDIIPRPGNSRRPSTVDRRLLFPYFTPMKTILILGAGRSSSSLIHYLLREANDNGWSVIVGDQSLDAATERVKGFQNGRAIHFDIQDEPSSEETIAQADVVVSLIPASLHPQVARLCLKVQKHLLTASYVSDEMQAFHEEAKKKNILFVNECGLDPGIDHMSAMKLIDNIKIKGGRIISFESFTGGLIAPETDPENPWRYKFTWNPRNVVTAGQSGAERLCLRADACAACWCTSAAPQTKSLRRSPREFF